MHSAVELQGLEKRFGAMIAVRNLSCVIAPGEAVCLLGPSGCGKTTTIRMIAGLELPDGGRVLINGVDVTHAPPYLRDIGLVFQDYALFPHMTVAENIAFGLRHRRAPKSSIPARVTEALRLVRLEGLAGRRPAQLSGGQQQRVALARALVTRPAVLLLDEPLSNLDAKLRSELRTEIRAILREVGITSIIVTHDQDEAMGLADRIIVMNNGAMEQIGRPIDVYDAPRTRFVAEFLGQSNWLAGSLEGRSDAAMVRFLLRGGEIVLAIAPEAEAPQGFDLCVRAERIGVGPTETIARGDLNVLQARVATVEALGGQMHVHMTLATGDSVLASLPRTGEGWAPGSEVAIWFRPQDARLIPRPVA